MIVMRWPRPGRLLASQAWVLVTRWAYHDHHEMASAFKLRCKSVSLLRVSLLLVPLLISAPAFQISNQAVARSMRFHIFHGTNSPGIGACTNVSLECRQRQTSTSDLEYRVACRMHCVPQILQAENGPGAR